MSNQETDDQGWTVVASKKKLTKPKNKAKSGGGGSISYRQPTGGFHQGQSGGGRGGGGQDWNTLVLRKKPDYHTKAGKQRAIRQGNFTTVSKGKTGQNKGYDSRHMAKIDNETENFTLKTVDKKWSSKIQQARMAKGLNQKELAQKMNVTVDVVAKYEKGTAIQDGETLRKFQKVLGI